jgi:subtilisin family serine protease
MTRLPLLDMSRVVPFGIPALALFALAATVGAGTPEEESPGEQRYIVKFRDFVGAASEVRAAGGQVAVELAAQKAIAAYLPEQALSGLQKNPKVEYVEIDARRYPMAQTKPYGISMVQADDPAFATSGASAASAVCIIDSGYYLAHEDLQDSNVTGTNDPGTGNWQDDDCGHGSHVAGTIAALNNAVGVVGVNANGALRLHIERVFKYNGASCAWAYSSSLVEALNRCQSAVAATGEKLVVNMSLGGGTPSITEEGAFQSAYDAGVLSFAAAGNGGSTATSYPAGYSSVISVAAVDSAGAIASFSQQNADVELAAPGVGVLSTTPFKQSTLKAGSDTWIGYDMTGSARVDVSGPLVDGGLCTVPGAWTGKVVLCQRGSVAFATKVENVRAGGGLGTAIYNNVAGIFAGTLGGTSTIPAISLSLADGQAALAYLGQPSSLANSTGFGSGYEYYSGTSMAAPHAAGVAALVWSLMPSKTNAQVREALQKSATDLGAPGRDDSFGYGLVQAKAAYDYLNSPVVKVGLKSLALKSSLVAGCKSVTATVTLTGPAPAGGLVVTLADTLGAASTPATLKFLEGVSSKNFVVRTAAVASPESGQVSTTLDGTTLSQDLTLRPMGLYSLTLTPNPVVGGNPVSGTAKLECKAGPGPISVALSSSNPAIASPDTASLVIPGGTQSMSFGVTTFPVAARAKATISGTANALSKSKILTVNPL